MSLNCKLLIALALVMGRAPVAFAQVDPAADQAPAPSQAAVASTVSNGEVTAMTEWVVLGGGAYAVSVLNSKVDREFVLTALAWGREVTPRLGPGWVAGRLELMIEVVPAFVIFQQSSSYGFGVTPVFFRWNFDGWSRLKPFIEISGGILRTDRAVPEGTKRFNFTAHSGPGLRLRVNERSSLLFGYRFHHLSNAGRASTNPSVNSNLFYMGVSLAHAPHR